jgi:hypothetical protein
MNIIEYINKLLIKGLCLKVLYTDKKNIQKFVILINSNWLNKLNIYDKKFKKNTIIDICLDKTFNFKNKSHYDIEYINLPENFDPQIIDDLNLDNDEIHLDNLRDAILDNKIRLRNYLSFHKINNSSIDEEENFDSNQIILITYPNYKKYANNFKKFKNEILKKYFILGEVQNEKDDNFNLLNTFNFLGINIKNKEVTDLIFINALKERWNFIIKDAKDQMYKNLMQDDILNKMEDFEKEEYLQELSLFKEHLFKDDMETLKNFKTIKEIISYWPSILHPIPNFVYNEY